MFNKRNPSRAMTPVTGRKKGTPKTHQRQVIPPAEKVVRGQCRVKTLYRVIHREEWVVTNKKYVPWDSYYSEEETIEYGPSGEHKQTKKVERSPSGLFEFCVMVGVISLVILTFSSVINTFNNAYAKDSRGGAIEVHNSKRCLPTVNASGN